MRLVATEDRAYRSELTKFERDLPFNGEAIEQAYKAFLAAVLRESDKAGMPVFATAQVWADGRD